MFSYYYSFTLLAPWVEEESLDVLAQATAVAFVVVVPSMPVGALVRRCRLLAP